MNRLCLVLLTLVLTLSTSAQNKLQPNDFVAIAGDSITEQKLYSVFIQDYLLMCKPQPDLRAMQFGWGGETSWGFLSKMPNEALKFDMTVATTCYGMNDGGYSPMNPQKAQKYREAMQSCPPLSGWTPSPPPTWYSGPYLALALAIASIIASWTLANAQPLRSATSFAMSRSSERVLL